MYRFGKNFVAKKLLPFLARRVLKKYKPDVVAITGSVGKTSTREAVFCVLRSKFQVRQSIRNYNDEFGVPLTILDEESAGRNIFGWLKIALKGLKLILFRYEYPEILVLEMAADRPGDIRYLARLVPIKVAIVTSIGPTHLEFFNTIENIADEKEVLVKALQKDGTAILNFDNPWTRKMKESSKGKTLTYGFGGGADVRATGLEENIESSNLKLSFKLNYRGNVIPVRLFNALGKSQVYAALAGVAVGVVFRMNLVDISKALRKYVAPCGRMRIISGIKNTQILDDTYNAVPESAISALEVLSRFKDERKIAVLGDMLELGSYTEKGHRKVGDKVAQVCDFLVVVGSRAKFISDRARKNGMSNNNIFEFNTADEAKMLVQNKIEPQDVILVKGSRAMKMEKIVKEIMAHPEKADEVLVQD